MGKNPQAKATIKDSDWFDYIELLNATRQEPIVLEKLTPDDERKLKNDCWVWIQNGKPKATMPEMQDKSERIIKLYRVKDQGKQYLFYLTKDGKWVGREWKNTYRKEEEFVDGKPTGKFIENKKQIIKSEPIYSIPFKKELAKELAENCEHNATNPVFAIIKGRTRISMHDASDFVNADVDKVVKETLQVKHVR